MRYLFVHQNMPGQFKHIAARLAAQPGNEVVFITTRREVEMPGVRKVLYAPKREPAPSTHPYIVGLERGVLHGQQVARVAMELKARGFTPDIIIGHPGWGEMLYLKEVWPDAPVLCFFEFYYHPHGADVGFNPEEPRDLNDACRIRTKNLINMMSLEAADAGISPTFWQYSLHPPEYQHKIAVIFDGIDTALCAPEPPGRLALPDGRVLTREDEVVTYVARNLEPYRGFPWFMRAVERIHRRRPNTHVVVVGGDDISYGRRLANGETWREKMLAEVNVDRSRLHFLGKVPYNGFLTVLKVSSAHVYLTYPFVLSWSMVEAMSTGCLVIGSNTPPVQEVLEHGVNGLVTDFFDPDRIADSVDLALNDRAAMAPLREAARRTVLERYDLGICLPRQLELVDALVAGKRPQRPPAHHQAGAPILV